MKPFISSDAARESTGTSSPGRYLPVRTPSASGDQTTWEIPFSCEIGNTPSSGDCQSIEYCGWDDTNVTSDGAASSPARIWSGVHSLNPR